MKNKTLKLVAGLCLVASTSAYSVDMGGIIQAQIILGQITQIADKYKDVQDLLNAGTIQLDVPEPIEGNTGKFYFPYDQSGYMTPWAEKALNAQIGAEAGAKVADSAISSLASKVPFGGLMAGKAKDKAKETGAVLAIGGWDFVRENTDTSFDSLADMSVYMHAEFDGETDYETALAAAMALYPELERGHQRAIDKAYKDARKQARKLN